MFEICEKHSIKISMSMQRKVEVCQYFSPLRTPHWAFLTVTIIFHLIHKSHWKGIIIEIESQNIIVHIRDALGFLKKSSLQILICFLNQTTRQHQLSKKRTTYFWTYHVNKVHEISRVHYIADKRCCYIGEWQTDMCRKVVSMVSSK